MYFQSFLQHFIFVIAAFLAWLVPDVPQSVKNEIRREKLLAYEAVHARKEHDLEEVRSAGDNHCTFTPSVWPGVHVDLYTYLMTALKRSLHTSCQSLFGVHSINSLLSLLLSLPYCRQKKTLTIPHPYDHLDECACVKRTVY